MAFVAPALLRWVFPSRASSSMQKSLMRPTLPSQKTSNCSFGTDRSPFAKIGNVGDGTILKFEIRYDVVAVVAGTIRQGAGGDADMSRSTIKRAQSTKWQSSPRILPPPLEFCCTQ